MRLKELLKIMDDETFVTIEDAKTTQEISGEVGNSIIQRLDGYVISIGISLKYELYIKVEFEEEIKE